MADPHQLVLHLLPLGFQLHGVGEGLPPAAAAYAKVLTEGFQPVGRRLYNALDKAFHIVLFLLVYLDVHHIAGNGEIYKNHHSVHVGEGFPLGGDGFDGHILQKQVYSFS